MNKITGLKPMRNLTLHEATAEIVGCKDWKCWLSEESPLSAREDNKNIYSDWLRLNVVKTHGIYIWLYQLQQDKRYRFIHVGLSKSGDSTVAERTKDHCRNAINGPDPTYRIDICNIENPFGGLIKIDGKTHADEAERFISNIRVLILLPIFEMADIKQRSECIAQMEGCIAHTAAKIFRGGTTNTLSKVRPSSHCPDETFPEMRDALNEIVEMFPSR